MEVDTGMGGCRHVMWVFTLLQEINLGQPEKWIETCVCWDLRAQSRAVYDTGKGVHLIVITVVLCGLLKSQMVEVRGEWGLIEDGLKWGMMGEVECKHVSICCWDGRNLQKEFSPWPSLPEALGCCPRLSGVTRTDTKTQRNSCAGIMAAWLCLLENKSEIKHLWARVKDMTSKSTTRWCTLLGGDCKFLPYILFLSWVNSELIFWYSNTHWSLNWL